MKQKTTQKTYNFLGETRKVFSLFAKIIQILWYWGQRIFLLIFLLLLTIGLAWWLSQKPSLLRDWEPQDRLIPTISWSGDVVHIKKIRNHQWHDENHFTENYFDDSYNINEVTSLYYIITPFSDRDGPAHTMLSFGFSNGKNLVISAEIRKEYGESFSPVRGILNQYEMQYVIGTEEDLIKLRTNYRKNTVIMYPIKTTQEKMSHLFRSMIIRADKLSHEPEFYNTIFNNCTTSLLAHANAFREEKISWNIYALLPSHSDEILYQKDLINTKLPLDEARKYYTISHPENPITTAKNFSEIIRKPIQ